MAYASLNVRDGADGQARWDAAGRPVVPSLVIGAEAMPILHVSQLAAALGLPTPERTDGTGLAADTADLLRAWLDQLRPLPLSLHLRPTPSRGRTLRNLTVNVFQPFWLLPGAWAGGGFPWRPEEDDLIEAPLRTAGDIIAYAESIHAAWSDFLAGCDDFERPGLVVPTPRGALGWLDLLDHQRWHAAFHYRQLVEFLDHEGVAHAPPLPLALLDGLELPEEVW